MKNLYLIIAISLLPTLSFGQYIGDTLFVFVDNKIEIKIAIPDYEELKSSDSVPIALREFKQILPEFKDELSSDEADLVKFSIGGPLTLKKGDPTIIYLQKEDGLTNTGFRDQAILSGENYIISITTTDMSIVSDLSLSECVEKVIAMLPKKTHWPKSLSYECIDGSITELANKNNQVDFLELQLGAGAGLVKSTWVADISFGVSLSLNHKGMARSPYVSANMVFDFDAESKMHINTFLNVGYRWNLSKKSVKPNMLGVELGYLIVKQGDLFGDNTLKFGVNWSPAKHITVSPQLFITDNFKQAFPGIRVGFGF